MDYLEHADGNPLNPVTVSDLIGTLPEKFGSVGPSTMDELKKGWKSPLLGVLLVLMVLSSTSSGLTTTQTDTSGLDIAQLVLYCVALVVLGFHFGFIPDKARLKWLENDVVFWGLLVVSVLGVVLSAVSVADKNKNDDAASAKKRQELNGGLAGVLAVFMGVFYFFKWRDN
jgi:hypothetical protein